MTESLYSGMPRDLVFVRHGESEANVIQRAEKNGIAHPQHSEIFARPDWQQRLATIGVEQAKNVGLFLQNEFGGPIDEVFDGKYTSTFIRSRETAAHLGGLSCGGWRLFDLLVERSWGIYGALPRDKRDKVFPLTSKIKVTDPLYAGLDGGEALASGVLLRFYNFLNILRKEPSKKKVLVVAHGELIQVARYVLELMLPEQFDAMNEDKGQKIRNCSILHYTRVNPEDESDIRKRLSWMRIIYPDKPSKSPNNGQWQEIGNGKTKSGSELLDQVTRVPRLLED